MLLPGITVLYCITPYTGPGQSLRLPAQEMRRYEDEPKCNTSFERWIDYVSTSRTDPDGTMDGKFTYAASPPNLGEYPPIQSPRSEMHIRAFSQERTLARIAMLLPHPQ